MSERDLKRLPARFYRTESGREPVREWLKGLDQEDRRIIGEDIKDVEFSWPIGMPLVRPPRFVGSAKQLAPRPYRPCNFLRPKRVHRTPAWLHEEDAENTATGTRSGAETHEGDGSMKRKNIGSTFDSWLREEGLYEKVSATAIKRVIARQVAAAMQQKGLTKLEMARRMRTSRAALDRLLDPDNEAVTLSTIQKAAAAVGRQIRLELV